MQDRKPRWAGRQKRFGMEFARAREIKPRLDDWKRELALFTLVQRERYYPTTYLDGNETAQ